jgi:hypothetical protein
MGTPKNTKTQKKSQKAAINFCISNKYCTFAPRNDNKKIKDEKF